MPIDNISLQLDKLVQIIEQSDQAQLIEQLNQMHEADAAELIELLTPSYRKEMIQLLAEQFNPVILTYLDDTVRESVLDLWAQNQLTSALSKLDESDAIELLEEFTPEERKNLLRTLKPELRIALEESLSYPDASAGRLMEHEFIALPANMSALQAAAFLHGVQVKSLDSGIIFLVDRKRKPIAQLDFAKLLLAHPNQILLDISEEIVCTMDVFDNLNDIALNFRKYFVSVIVVLDVKSRIVGILQLHNIIDAVYDQAEQGLLQSAGVTESDFYKTIWSSISARLKWIAVAGLYSLISAWIISIFQDVIEKHAIIPALNQVLLAAIGTAGMQAVTITTRALMDKELISVNAIRAIRRETMIGVINGLMLSPILGFALYCYSSKEDALWISMVFGVSIFFGLIIANFAGAIIPILLARFKIDPSIGSSSLLVSFVDASSLLLIFALARLCL